MRTHLRIRVCKQIRRCACRHQRSMATIVRVKVISFALGSITRGIDAHHSNQVVTGRELMPKPPTIPTFSDLYQHALGDRPWLGAFLSGHLAVEFMLRKLISQYDVKLTMFADELRHKQLIDLNGQIGTISPAQTDVLIAINQMRNKLAHQITYDPSIAEMMSLWTQSANAFTDLTDGISQGLEEMTIEGNLNTLDAWVFSELFVQICYDLHIEYTNRGGDDEVF
jgi:hypothetical protein